MQTKAKPEPATRKPPESEQQVQTSASSASTEKNEPKAAPIPEIPPKSEQKPAVETKTASDTQEKNERSAAKSPENKGTLLPEGNPAPAAGSEPKPPSEAAGGKPGE